MSKIRKVYFFDKKNAQEMISFLNNNVNDKYINQIMFHPLMPFHYLLPLKFKFLPESYVLKDGNKIKGLITVAPTKCKYKKMEIQKLLFEENSLTDATELVQFAVSKYKAMGATSIQVKVDDYLTELITLFTTKCGFSEISKEKTWRINKFIDAPFDKKEYRPFKNSDAKAIRELYNDALLPHFRPLLGRDTQEFKEPFCKGLSYFYEYKYVIEDKNAKKINGCVIIQTSDNENFIINIIQNNWIDLDINSIISFAIEQIKKRKKRFGVFIKTKQFLTNNDKNENQFIQNGYECVQNQILLTNSSARILKDTTTNSKFTVLTDFFPTDPISTHCNKL